jgi:hypothetical protein
MINDDCYKSKEETHILQREYGFTPYGNPLCGKWVYSVYHNFVDFDQYRNDIAERHNLTLVNNTKGNKNGN